MFTKINTKMNEARDEEGFTLIELLVVILIIGILAAIAIPVFLNQQKAAVKGGIKSDVRNTATNVATSLVTSPSATGFTPYAAGATAPAVTGGAVAVQTVNTSDDVITITKNPASGAAPSTGTGAGQWDDYQIVGTSARVPNYCFVFSSTSGKYTEYNDCTVAAGTGSGSGGSTSTPTPTASTPFVATDVYYENFDPAKRTTFPEWSISRDNQATWAYSPSIAGNNTTQTTAQNDGNKTTLGYQSPGPFNARLILPTDLEAGTYTVSMLAYVNINGNFNWTFSTSPSGGSVSNKQVGTPAWTNYTFNFTVASKGPVTIYVSNDRTSTSVLSSLDNVRVTKTS